MLSETLEGEFALAYADGHLTEVFEKQPGWAMPEAIDVLENPDFEMRLWSGNSFSSREWLARSSRMGFHHALGYIFHPDKHGDTPEVYPLIKGKRYIPDTSGGRHGSSGWQPCTGSPKSVEIAVDHVLTTLEKNPRGISVSLSVNDGAGNVWINPAMRKDSDEILTLSKSRFVYSRSMPLGARYAHATGSNGVPPFAGHPVCGVSWLGVAKFCNWLTLATGRGEAALCYGEGTNTTDWAPVPATNWPFENVAMSWLPITWCRGPPKVRKTPSMRFR